MLQFIGDNKRLLHLHEQKLSDLEVFKSDTQIFSEEYKCLTEEPGNISRVAGLEYADPEQGCIPK